MNSKHKDIQQRIKETFPKRFSVNCEAVDGKNYLPTKKYCVYQPDVVVKAKKSGIIKYIIEIECDPVRKALVGASVLADYSIGYLRYKTKPSLIFVVYSREGIKQLENFEERAEIARKYCKNIKHILVLTEKEFFENFLKKINSHRS